MTFILPATFKAKEGQSSIMYRDVEENETPMALIIEGKDEPRRSPYPKSESEKLPTEWLEKKIEIIEHSECGSRVVILRQKKSQDGESKKPVKVVLKRPSKKMSQHLKPLYIKVYLDSLPVDRILVDGGSAINVLPQIICFEFFRRVRKS